MFYEVQQRELRRVRAQVEHALARERAARVHAVEPADQLVALPSLHAVRLPAPVKLAVAPNHRGRYPCALLVRAHYRAARAYDPVEGPVYGEREARAAALAREASRDVQLVEE